MDDRRFDRLTRAWAGGLNRRRLLRAVAAGLGGLVLGGGHARANNDASEFCRRLPPGQRGKCRSDAARGNPAGLFAQCEGDPDRLCPATDGSVACCGAGEGCCAGSCVDLSSDATCGDCGTACLDGRVCVNGGCCQASIGGPCDPNGCCVTGLCDGGFCRYADPGESCDEDADCASFRCDPGTQRCTLLGAACSSDAGCEPGQTCFAGTCRCCSNIGPNRGPGWCTMPDGSLHSTTDVCCPFPQTALACCPLDGSPGYTVCCDGLICPPCDGSFVHTGAPICGGACTAGCGCTPEGGSCTGDSAGVSLECCSGICCGGTCCGLNAHGCESNGACF